MKEINVTEADIVAVTTKLKQIASDVSTPTGSEWSYPPAIKVIDCVLSLNRKYDTFVVPRLKTFMNNHPETQRVVELAKLIANYPTPHAFVQQELNYNHEDRAKTLDAVVKYLCTIIDGTKTLEEEKKGLTQWAIESKPHDYQVLKIKGFGIAGFQYLRMLFGVDTTKPDVHIIRYLSDILNRRVSTTESLLLLESASARAGLSVRGVDSYIWKKGARPTKTTDNAELNDRSLLEYDETLLKDGTRGKYAERYAEGTNIVKLDPDVADAFPNEEAVNEALRFMATFDYTYKPVSTSTLAFKVAERCWWRKTADKNIANMFGTSIENLEHLFKTDAYKQSVFNLMCVQYDAQGFEHWVRTYPRMASVFSQRMKLDKANHEKMLAGVRAFHAAAKEGVRVKVMKQRQNPYKE